MTLADRANRVTVLWAGWFNRVSLCARGKERLTNDRVFEEVKHVGGVSPQIGSGGRGQLGPQLRPGCSSVIAICARIDCAQRRCHHLLHGIVDMKTIQTDMDE